MLQWEEVALTDSDARVTHPKINCSWFSSIMGNVTDKEEECMELPKNKVPM